MESKVWNGLSPRGGGKPTNESEANGTDAGHRSHRSRGRELRERLLLAASSHRSTSGTTRPGLYAVKDRDIVQRPGGQPRDRRKQPDATHGPNSGSDVNEFGLIDMAGNGRELTRILQGEPVREVLADTPPPLESDSVILRGRNFVHSTGLTFTTLRYEHTTPQRQFANARSPFTSFRVVVRLP